MKVCGQIPPPTASRSAAGYTFTGIVTGGTFSRSYTGPGSTSGGFSAISGTTETLTAYCDFQWR